MDMQPTGWRRDQASHERGLRYVHAITQTTTFHLLVQVRPDLCHRFHGAVDHEADRFVMFAEIGVGGDLQHVFVGIETTHRAAHRQDHTCN